MDNVDCPSFLNNSSDTTLIYTVLHRAVISVKCISNRINFKKKKLFCGTTGGKRVSFYGCISLLETKIYVSESVE